MRISKFTNSKSLFALSFIIIFLSSLLFILILPIMGVSNQNALNQPEVNTLPNKIKLNTQAWVVNGTAIGYGSYMQNSLQLCSDRAGGAIITWIDDRNSIYWDIYAQRVTSMGGTAWTGNGIAICTASWYQSYPQICTDGVGGAIIIWEDFRSGTSYDIYAQRINSLGTVQWTANGVVICTASNDQRNTQLCSDGAGGAIIVWEDYRSGTSYDIYAQRINSLGTVQWTANGVVICTAGNDQRNTRLCSDGAGGVIIVWEDYRSGTSYDIYAQRINSLGTVQWTANGVAICTASNNQNAPQLCSNVAGGAIITWQDLRNGGFFNDIYAQRINSLGTVQWTANGVAICTANNNQNAPQLCNDGTGGAIITWQDNRSGYGDIYAQRPNSAGVMQWTVNGTVICTATGNQNAPRLSQDGSGGAIITWEDFRNGPDKDIYAQQVNLAGVMKWLNGTVICTATGNQASPHPCADGAGGALITWVDYRSGGSGDIYAQKLDVSPPGNFTIYSPIGWISNQRPTVICKFYENASGVDVSSVQFAYSANGLITPTNWTSVSGTYRNAACSNPAADGDSGWLYARVLSVPFNQDSGSQNTIRFRARDMANQTGTQETAFIIQTDASIDAPNDVSASPSDWTGINSFNITWTNPSDLSGIVGMYYKLDSPPVSNTNGTYVAGAGINEIVGITVSGDGVHIIYLWLVDTAGTINFSKSNNTVIRFDSSIDPPEDLRVIPNGWTNLNMFNLTWKNPADLSGILGAYYKLDSPPGFNTDGTYIAGAEINTITGIFVEGDGIHAVYLWLVDAVGNINFTKYNTTALRFDSTMESPMRLQTSPNQWTNINSFNLTWTNPSDLSGIVGAYYKLDSPPSFNTNGTYIAGEGLNKITGITVSDDGVHTIYLWLVDAAGNINFNKYNSTVVQFDSSIDPPMNLSIAPTGWSTINMFNLTWKNPADLSGILGAYYKLDSPPGFNTDGTYIAGAGINTITGISVGGDGTHPVFLWIVDAVGNIDFIKYNETVIRFDSTMEIPMRLLTSQTTWTNKNSFNLTWSNPSDLSGIVGAYYKLDSPPILNTDGTYIAATDINTITGITVSGDGVHTVYIWLQDQVGNIDFNKFNTTILQMDRTIEAPSGLLAWPTGQSNINSFNLTWSNPSDLSGINGVYYKLDSPPISNVDGIYVAGVSINKVTEITVLGNGSHPVFVWLVDAAGNVDFTKYSTTVLYLGSANPNAPPSVDPILPLSIIAAATILGVAIVVHGLLVRKQPLKAKLMEDKRSTPDKPPKEPPTGHDKN